MYSKRLLRTVIDLWDCWAAHSDRVDQEDGDAIPKARWW
jgi:hypothetical protein